MDRVGARARSVHSACDYTYMWSAAELVRGTTIMNACVFRHGRASLHSRSMGTASQRNTNATYRSSSTPALLLEDKDGANGDSKDGGKE